MKKILLCLTMADDTSSASTRGPEHIEKVFRASAKRLHDDMLLGEENGKTAGNDNAVRHAGDPTDEIHLNATHFGGGPGSSGQGSKPNKYVFLSDP